MTAMTTKYGPVLRQLLPPGPAFTAPDDSEFADLLDGMAEVFDDFAELADALLEEFDPTTTTDLLADWERLYGLPGDNPSPPSSTADRRTALAAKMLGYDDPTQAAFVALALTLGYASTITQRQYPIMRCNSLCNAVLYTDPWAFVWTMTQDTAALNTTLEWLIESMSPAHTLVTFVYT